MNTDIDIKIGRKKNHKSEIKNQKSIDCESVDHENFYTNWAPSKNFYQTLEDSGIM